MCFWWFMLICDMIIPIVMVIVGRMMWKHCPKHIMKCYTNVVTVVANKI